jgi:hypothetical protein
MWMAGGGIRKGYVHGETDDFCYNTVALRSLMCTGSRTML